MRLCLPAMMLLTFARLLIPDSAMAQAQPDPPVWYWLGTLNSTSPVKAAHPTDYWLTLREDHVAIRADCNRGTGPYELKDGEISFKPMALTRKLCVQGSRGAYYAAQLQSAQKFLDRDGTLAIDLKAGEGTMFFAQNPKARLAHFRCPDGATFSAIFIRDQAQVWFGGEYFKLTGQKTAAGTRYADDRATFETRGELGSLRKGDRILAKDCEKPVND